MIQLTRQNIDAPNQIVCHILTGLHAVATHWFLVLLLLYRFELELSSLPTNTYFLAPVQYNMVNLRTLTSVTYLAQVAFLGGDAQTNGSQLRNIIPKREVLYVGGQYTDITASLDSHYE